jgi:hypothetical protein
MEALKIIKNTLLRKTKNENGLVGHHDPWSWVTTKPSQGSGGNSM